MQEYCLLPNQSYLLTTALLVDHHPLFREGVALLLRSEFPQCKVLQVGSLGAALERLEVDPGIALVLFDIALPDSAGLAGLRRLRSSTTRPRYVVVSAIDHEGTMREAIDHGAAGFIAKTSYASEMLHALQVVMRGGIHLPQPAKRSPPAQTATPGPRADVTLLGLSPRQVDVLQLLIEGLSNKSICRELVLSESTVKTHLAIIFRKLGAGSRTQAIAAAMRMGLRLPATPTPA